MPLIPSVRKDGERHLVLKLTLLVRCESLHQSCKSPITIRLKSLIKLCFVKSERLWIEKLELVDVEVLALPELCLAHELLRRELN